MKFVRVADLQHVLEVGSVRITSLFASGQSARERVTVPATPVREAILSGSRLDARCAFYQLDVRGAGLKQSEQ
jgi:hypothetical protein